MVPKVISIIFIYIIHDTIGSPRYLKIVNGTDARQGEFPFMVSLRNGDKHICGGTILSEDYILTAAHCVCTNFIPNNAGWYNIQYGLVNKTVEPINVIPIQQIFCSNDGTQTHDVAILLLSYSLPVNDYSWNSVSLYNTFDCSYQTTGVIAGWGRYNENGTSATTLQKLTVDVYSDSVCGTKFDSKSQLCLGSPYGGACFGDSGSCLMVNGIQAGIASFITTTCGISNPSTPNVYTRVDANIQWISSTAKLTQQ